MDKITLFLEKVGTFMADRRLWVAGLVVLILALTGYAGIPPELQQQIADAFGETFSAGQGMVMAAMVFSVALGKLIALVMVAVKLMQAWTERPPSGLSFKEIAAPSKVSTSVSSTVTSNTATPKVEEVGRYDPV